MVPTQENEHYFINYLSRKIHQHLVENFFLSTMKRRFASNGFYNTTLKGIVRIIFVCYEDNQPKLVIPLFNNENGYENPKLQRK